MYAFEFLDVDSAVKIGGDFGAGRTAKVYVAFAQLCDALEARCKGGFVAFVHEVY